MFPQSRTMKFKNGISLTYFFIFFVSSCLANNFMCNRTRIVIEKCTHFSIFTIALFWIGAVNIDKSNGHECCCVSMIHSSHSVSLSNLIISLKFLSLIDCFIECTFSIQFLFVCVLNGKLCLKLQIEMDVCFRLRIPREREKCMQS